MCYYELMIKSFLIVKTSSVGDIIQSFPVLQYLHAKFPGCQIDWVVEKRYADLLTAHPLVNRVFFIDSYTWRKNWFRQATWKEIFSFKSQLQKISYEAIFDLQGNIKSAFITSGAKGKSKIGFGWSSVAEKPNVFVTTHRFNVADDLPIQQRYLSLVQSYFKETEEFQPSSSHLKLSDKEEQDLKKMISHPINFMVAFGSKWENKQLSSPTLECFLQKIDSTYHPYFFFVGGNEKEKKRAEELTLLFSGRSNSLGHLSFPFWQGLMREMDCVIAMDSAALHLCGTTETPSFSVFGPSSSSVYKPVGEHHTSVQGVCPYHQHFVKRCPLLRTCSTGACIKNLEAEALFESFCALNTRHKAHKELL